MWNDENGSGICKMVVVIAGAEWHADPPSGVVDLVL